MKSSQLKPIQNVYISAYTVAPAFTRAMLAIRYTFFAVSCLSLLYWMWRMMKVRTWQIEQKMTLVLSILQPLFNDPLIAITVHAPNIATSVIGVIFVTNFVCFMTLNQLVQFHRILLENGEKESKALDWKKVLACSLMWIFMFATYVVMEIHFFIDPTATYEDYGDQAFLALKVVFYIIVAGILGWIIFYYVQYCRFYDTRMWRYKQTGLFSIYFIVSLQLFLFTGSFTPHQFDGQKVLLTIGVLNLYVFYLQNLWLPAKGQLEKPARKSLEHYMQENQQYDQLPDNFIIEEEPAVVERPSEVELQDINVDDQS